MHSRYSFLFTTKHARKTHTLYSQTKAEELSRMIPAPGSQSLHRADMIVKVSDQADRSVPVWVAQAESPAHVIDVVLSVYVRRGKLPEVRALDLCIVLRCVALCCGVVFLP